MTSGRLKNMVNLSKNNRTYVCLYLLLAAALFITGCSQSPDNPKPIEPHSDSIVVATMGASLMFPQNGWVEKACADLGLVCLNKAVSGALPIDFARKLWKGTYATEEELASIDVMLIQFANNVNVYAADSLRFPTADEYTASYTDTTEEPFAEYKRAQQMDYILKKWTEICLKHNKPANIILVTHWHDARTIYGASVRKLAQRWDADLCELDKNIGFTKDVPLPDGRQHSLLYAIDTETIDSIEYGWHPLRGTDGEYIQSVMANILKDKLQMYIAEHDIHP